MSEIFEGKVLSLSSEGQGITKQNHLVVFVPFTAPGDIIQYQMEHQKKKFSLGKLVKVLQPSPARTTPLCRYYGRCGGCQLQHIKYEAQIESKYQLVLNALQRIGKLQNIPMQPVERTERYWAYRRHITLQIREEDQNLSAGYISIDNTSMIHVEHCPIFIEESDTAIQELQLLLKKMSSKGFSEGTATLYKAQSKKMILSLHFDNKLNFEEGIFEKFLLENPRWQGLVLHEGKNKKIWGMTKDILNIDSMLFSCSPDVFTQIHPEQSLKIYQQIAEIASSVPGSKVWDLYCGIGITSLMLAKQGHEVIGVEFNPDSVRFAQENATVNGITNASFIQGDVEQVLQRKLKNEKKIELIIINPPRIGLTPRVIEEILKRQPQQIIYISCMPSTLARDLKILCARDYELSLVKSYDMFPQTFHVETLVLLKHQICC